MGEEGREARNSLLRTDGQKKGPLRSSGAGNVILSAIKSITLNPDPLYQTISYYSICMKGFGKFSYVVVL